MAASSRSVSRAPKPQGSSPSGAPASSKVFGGAVQLEAELAGVAGLGHQGLHVSALAAEGHIVVEAIVFGRDVRLGADLFQNVSGPGALEGQLRHLVGDIGEAHVSGQAGGDPVRVLFMVAGIDYQQIFFRTLTVDHQVVHNAAPLIAEHGVFHLAVGHFAQVRGNQPLEIRKGIRPLQQQLRHVGYVE